MVMDRSTGLTWQQSGPEDAMRYADAQNYVKELNHRKFAGYDDWRLPTIPELMSLLEPEEKNGDLFIDPIFDKKQRWCWSADTGSAWGVYFNFGHVYWSNMKDAHYVRVVRS